MNHLADYYSRDVDIVDGDGAYLFDKNGKKYLDFLAGWCVGNIGWKRKEVRAAIKKEAERGVYVPPVLKFPAWEEFADLLAQIAPNGSASSPQVKKLTRAFRCTSGSEAVEFAIKCARAASGKSVIVSVDGVYHGHTYGAASVGDACTKSMAPCLPDFLKIPMPDTPENAAAAIKKFRAIVKKENVAAFLSEPVFTNAGSIVPPADFYPEIEKICRDKGILLIMDEVATGFGRCGKLFASELWGLKPDILCLGKALTGGYGTMGATLVTEEIFKAGRNIPFYSTFGWLPTDLAAAKANIEVLLAEKLWENARGMGDYVIPKLKQFEKLDYVASARGIGMLWGIEINDGVLAQKLQDRCAEEGLLLETAGATLFMTPPLTLTKKQADDGLAILAKVLR